MSTNAVSALPTALAGLLKQYTSPAQKSDGTTAATTASAAASPLSLGRDEAFSLSLGSAQSGQAMVGYTRLATLGGQADADLSAIASQSADSGSAGSVQVEVSQLATPQTLVTSLFGDPDSVSLGTGSLSVQMGAVDTETGAFTPQGNPTEISIAGGSLNDIAKSINDSGAGLTAKVVESGGGFELEISGKDTGSGKAFALSGLSELDFDPSHPVASPLTQTSEAGDAHYSADGTDYTWPSNTGVPVAFGTTASFTQTGSLSVDRSTTTDTVQKMMKSFNGLQQAIVEMTGDKGSLAANANLAAGMFKRLGDAAMAEYQTGGDVSTLSDIGIQVEKDGTLSVDQSVLAQALSKDPSSVQSLVAQAAKGMDDSIRPYLGNKGALSSQVSVLGSLMGRGASLLDYLGGGASSSSGLAGGATSLLSALS
ncbi:flagellar filament capping protein FliD [Paramagnetospirillum magnetotacticum]|nr:flagellar filament capping protein FliD [Paramagnetospirillum magnetotacticum]